MIIEGTTSAEPKEGSHEVREPFPMYLGTTKPPREIIRSKCAFVLLKFSSQIHTQIVDRMTPIREL